MEYQLFLGCVIPARIPFVEASARKVFDKLGIKLKDIKGASCCPDPTGIPAVDIDSWLALGARNLSIIEKNGNGSRGNAISLCSGCVETLKSVNHELKKDSNKRDEINRYLSKVGKKYDGTAEVNHAARILYENIEKIKENVVKPLEGFKVACHYGCHFLRPSEIIKWDDPLDPKTLDEIIQAIGAESIQYSAKLDCCGNPVGKTDEELSNKLIYKKLKSIAQSRANCVAVVCPACFQQFDLNQHVVNKTYNESYNFPVFYLTELIALAFGLEEKELGFKFHRTKTKQLLQDLLTDTTK
ncbi:MAG: CoB--CoM heterodisulfide reductase iron-sulfur subunit B family protein [Candidatus Helarchaeota archaeon]